MKYPIFFTGRVFFTRIGSPYVTYPNNYTDATGFLGYMKNKNLFAYPIEKVRYKNKNGSYSILEGELFKYKNTGSLDKILKLETSTPININSFKFSNLLQGEIPSSESSGSFLPDAGYSPKIIFTKHDIYGNPLEIKDRDGSFTSFIWGNRGMFLIAQVENAEYSSVVSAIGQENLDDLNSSTILNETNINLMNNLRNHPTMKKSLITSLTYDSFKNVSSVTNPQGITETYQYDGFQRLKNVLDFENNILKDYRYNYRP